MMQARCMRCGHTVNADGHPTVDPLPAEWQGHAWWCTLMRRPPTLELGPDTAWATGRKYL